MAATTAEENADVNTRHFIGRRRLGGSSDRASGAERSDAARRRRNTLPPPPRPTTTTPPGNPLVGGAAALIPRGGEEPREKNNLCREALLRMRMLRRGEDRKAPRRPWQRPLLTKGSHCTPLESAFDAVEGLI
ncbi:unnamed protein product [Rangifer tarandus platyrhynchus]|uniref:Uncharacterized protein n=1 Tax=Rangifer tarandus platyrhynchus TaxID=3082113 RepID=A0AC59ZI83_RANTA